MTVIRCGRRDQNTPKVKPSPESVCVHEADLRWLRRATRHDDSLGARAIRHRISHALGECACGEATT